VDNRNLGKLLGTIAEIEADETLGQMAALTELIEQHEQQAAAPLGK
jgi:hypothetical protein